MRTFNPVLPIIPRLAPFYLDVETKRDLLAFLDSLNGEGWQKITPPAVFP
jgi:hypothetical protein